MSGRRAIIVSGAPSSFLRRKTVKRHFSGFGTVENVGVRKNDCVVVFESSSSAEEALSKGTVWRGTDLKIDWWTEKQESIQGHHYEDELNWFAEDSLFSTAERTRTITAYKIKRTDFMKLEETENGPKPEVPKLKELSVPSPKYEDEFVPSTRPFEKRQAFTVREKFQVLEERDRHLRAAIEKDSDIKTAVAMCGTCPDMCPEKERLMREVRRMVSVYEMVPGTTELDPSLAVKQYSRSSADQEEPLQHELRPEPVLTMTMSYLITKIMCKIDEPEENLSDWYDFCWDRLRAIRKDIVQQQLSDINTVSIVEQCARFHICCFDRLLGTDVSVFDEKINTENLMNCLKALLNMYEDLRKHGVVCPNEAEFNAYMILLKLNSGDILWEYQKFPSVLQCSAQVQEAVRIHAMYNNNAYSTYFKIVCETSYLNACLMQRFFTHVRMRALRTIIKAYCPPNICGKLSLNLVAQSLKFDSLEEAVTFCESYGINLSDNGMDFKVFRNEYLQPDTAQWTVKYPSSLVTQKRVSFPQAVVGVQNHIPFYLEHKVHNSFNENHILLDGAFDASDQEEKLLRDSVLRDLLRRTKEKAQVSQESPQSIKTPSPQPLELMSVKSDEGDDVVDYPSQDESVSEDSAEESKDSISSSNSSTQSEETSENYEEMDSISESTHISVDSLSSSPGVKPNSEKIIFNNSYPLFNPPHAFGIFEPRPVESVIKDINLPDDKPKEYFIKLFETPKKPGTEILRKPLSETPRKLGPSKSQQVDLVLQKLRKKLHENMKTISVQKCARIWREKVMRLKKTRCLEVDHDLPFLCHPLWWKGESHDGSGIIWKTSKTQGMRPRMGPLVQRLNRYCRTDAIVKAVLRSDVIDRLDPDVKQVSEKIAELLGKSSVDYALKCGNIAQPPTVFWKLIFALPENTLGSTLHEKLEHWCTEAFYTRGSKLGDVELRLSDSGVPIYMSVRVLEGLKNSNQARNMSSLILIRVEGCESTSETKHRLQSLLSFKNQSIPVGVLNIGDISEPLDINDIMEDITTFQEVAWDSPDTLMGIFQVLVKGTYHEITGVEALSVLLDIVVDRFLDSLHEDSYLNDGLSLVLTEPNNIIDLFNLFLKKFESVLSSCYTKNIYGTACEFRPYIKKLNINERIPDLYDDSKFLQHLHTKISKLKMNPFSSWPPKSSRGLFESLKSYCKEIGCGSNVLSKIIRMINPPDDDDSCRNLMAHLFQTNWLHIVEILIKENIRLHHLNFNIAYIKSEIRDLWESHWWMYTEKVIQTNKTLDSW